MIGVDIVGVDIVVGGDDGGMYGWCGCGGPEIADTAKLQHFLTKNLLFSVTGPSLGIFHSVLSLELSVFRSFFLSISAIAEVS